MARNAPLSYYDMLTSPDIIVQQAEKRAWDDTKDEVPLVALLNLLPKGTPSTSKHLNFGIGNYYTDGLTLASAIVNLNVLTEITFAAGGDFLFDGDIVHLYEGSGVNMHNFAFIKIVARLSANKYRFERVNVSKTGALAFLVASTVVKLSSSAVPIHGDAREYLNKKGDIGTNFAQRSRDTVGKSDFEGEQTLIDNSMTNLTRMGWKFYAQKWSRALHTNMIARGGANEANEWMMTGGIPYFLNPADIAFVDSLGIRTAAHATFQGVNKVVSSATLSYNDLINWMSDLTFHGGKDKILLLPDIMYKLVFDLIRNNVALTRTDLRNLSIDLPYVWEANTIPMGFGNFHLLRDKTMNDAYIKIVDDTDGVTVGTPGYHMVALDPKFMRLRPYKNTAGKVMNMHMSGIDRINNGSVEKMEFDGMVGLEITEPRACGYFALKKP